MTEYNTKSLGQAERALLLAAAWHSLKKGTGSTEPPLENAPEHSPVLAWGASFVTIRRGGRLRGCIGTLEAFQPLIEDVMENASKAAFQDPRFPALSASEVADVDVQISVLSSPSRIIAGTRAELLAQLRPDRDGLILSDRGRRATFLPAVWESLRDPAEFLEQLLLKAGLPRSHWSPTMEAFRYSTQSFP